MRNFKIIHICIVFVVLFFGCNRPTPCMDLSNNLRGYHELKKLQKEKTERTKTSKMSGGFFFIIGGMSSETKETSKKYIYYAFKYRNQYIIQKTPLDKIRVEINNSIKSPMIKFRWDRCMKEIHLHGDVFDRYIIYAVICCREADWKTSIVMPMTLEEDN